MGDNADAFPDDPAASVDTDGDGHPDRWNEGMKASDSTTGLKKDAYPKDETRWKAEDSPSVGLLGAVVAIGTIAAMMRRRDRR